MIRNRLKELMDVRGLKATRIANDINNLSRNTINSTVSNSGKMIQFETVDLLCQYLGVTPKDFFEYLPFDVLVTVDSDNDPMVNISDLSNVAPDECYIKPFYLNLYLTKISNNFSAGESKKTFELSVISEKKIGFSASPDFGDNSFLMNVPDLKIILGNPPIKANMTSQKDAFSHFWNDELTDGFRKIMQDKISDAIFDYFSKFKSNNSFIDLPDVLPTIFRFTDFESDYSKLTNGLIMATSEFDVPF